MEDANAPIGATRRAARHNLPAAALATPVSAYRIAAEGALPLPHAAERNPVSEVALEYGEGEQRDRDSEDREHERPQVEWVDVVGDVVRGQNDGQDGCVRNDGRGDGEVPRPTPAQPGEQPVAERERRAATRARRSKKVKRSRRSCFRSCSAASRSLARSAAGRAPSTARRAAATKIALGLAEPSLRKLFVGSLAVPAHSGRRRAPCGRPRDGAPGCPGGSLTRCRRVEVRARVFEPLESSILRARPDVLDADGVTHLVVDSLVDPDASDQQEDRKHDRKELLALRRLDVLDLELACSSRFPPTSSLAAAPREARSPARSQSA